MSEDQFTKLFKYMQDQFMLVNQKLDEKASQESLDRLTNTIDSFVKRLVKKSEIIKTDKSDHYVELTTLEFQDK
jgi:uncharacterized protein YaaR (DUF327 family)